MDVAGDIQRIDAYLNEIEKYIQKGVWNPDKNSEYAARLVEIDISLNQLMVGSSLPGVELSDEQIKIVSALLKRFGVAKDHLPSPPWS